MTQIFEDKKREEAFRGRGYFVEPFFDEDELTILRDHHLSLNSNLPSDFYGTPFSRDIAYRRDIFETLERVAREKLAALVPDYELAMAIYFSKRENGTEGKVGLHHDYSLVREDRDVGVNLWIPLVDVDEDNGCLNVVPHSHSLCEHIAAIPSNPSPLEPFMPVIEEDHLATLPIKAGAAVIYQGTLLHSSNPNRSPHVRVACGYWMVPKGVNPHMYSQNPENPGELDLLEVNKEFLWQLEPEKPILEPYPEGVRFVESLQYAPKKIQPEDLQELVVS